MAYRTADLSKVGLQTSTFTIPLIDDGKNAKAVPIKHLVMNEVHAPVLIRPSLHRRFASQLGDAFAALDLPRNWSLFRL
ncbi:hypothetical protein ACOTDF_02475 [Achromobacter insuavis]|uniref:hypothetical protein n=1 Tax=Achromobacter insuavis TaxID=1287735 RepID=UPI003B9D0D03